ncbi:protein ALTERED PHOSPHATE STARVATION RESPONSE 1-like [Euphorbia lathyris]|uniref:protein ALTERED PHOSPHATE STARVATION RESPONSE 1-like n=1 Tax=Euphorbia lathyris TaxID=212925 RepID=UPI0033136F00
MGSSQSKNKNEEVALSLSRFKLRIQFIKQAISTRNAFFAALAAYAICLKNTGAALADGTHSHYPSSVDFLPPSPPLSNPNNPPPNPSLLPPPPPLPSSFAPKPVVPPIIMEEEELESEAEEFTRNPTSRGSVQQFKDEATRGTTMHHGSDWDYYFQAEDVVVEEKVQNTAELPMPMVKKRGGKLGRKTTQPVSLKQIFLDIDHHFLKAFESTLPVYRMLETTKLHYHSNFADNRPNEHINDRISHLISFKGKQGEDDLNTEEIRTLATVLDKMLAWENKLYDEVNAGEVIKYEYQKTVSLLNKQKKQGSNPKKLVKLDTAISHLHTRYIVEMQSAVSTIEEINGERDGQLYPRLVQLIDEMAMMWKAMLFHHESQAKIVYSLKLLDNPQLVKETSEYNCTIQLCGAVHDWHTQFCGLIEYQKDFISALHNWSKLILIPFDCNLKEKVFSPPRVPIENAAFHTLVIAWKNDLDKLPDEVAKNAIRNFAAITQTIVHQQEEELKTRERCKATQHLEEDEEACQKVCKAARDKYFTSLRYSLLEVFSAMSETAQACSDMYAHACSDMYRNLTNIL